MSFRKRNIPLPSTSPNTPEPASSKSSFGSTQAPGVRPSPLDGRPTTSTGTQTLDDLLGGHAGLPLGNSLLIEENGTTDFAGALLRFYAAEGVVQGHKVHVVGLGEGWGRELPGLTGSSDGDSGKRGATKGDKERMKIAWRYERLGEAGSGSRGGIALSLLAFMNIYKTMTFNISKSCSLLTYTAPPKPTPDRSPNQATQDQSPTTPPPAFSHTFDLTKRLSLAPNSLNYIPAPSISNPLPTIITSLQQSLRTSPPQTLHRLLIPSLLSPLLYPPSSTHPTFLLPFLHTLRALLRTHPNQLSLILTFPLSLHPRSSGLVRWIETLADGVLELAPFPHSIDVAPTGSKGGKRGEEAPQGILKVHKVPVVTEKGGGGGGGDDWAFSLSRRRFVVRMFSLPPVDGDVEAQKGEGSGKGDMEF
ncbi:hypothetical protein MMC21_003610 [Puttea exsequens]|nr:hypothetical protein [Puttea exsequens]